MGFDFNGRVLRAPRTAPTNSPTTAEVQNGVVRHLEEVPVGFAFAADAPSLVDVRGEQYRVAVLDAPGTTPVEYCIWAENTSNLAILDDPTWAIDTGSGRIPNGTGDIHHEVTGETLHDGTSNVIVTDDGNRSIASIYAVVLARGDQVYVDEGWVDPNDLSLGRKGDIPYITVLVGTAQDARVGIVRVDDVSLTYTGSAGVYAQGGGGATLASVLDGGLSRLRGDRVVAVSYTLASSRFWWTRNDRYQTRFGWSDALQRWVPYKGSHVINLGVLAFDERYTLSPKPKGLVAGTDLPGSGTDNDVYSMIRVGTSPGAFASQSVGSNTPGGFEVGVRVVNDEQVAGYDFAVTPTYAAVVGRIEGTLVFNPSFVEQHAGKTIWYSNRDFATDANGVVGDVLESRKAPLYLSPIPGLMDFPLMSLGSRAYLTPIVVPTESQLPDSSTLVSGEVAVAASTGRVVLSFEDINKADPDEEAFDKHFLGEVLVYHGLALNAQPQSVKKPVELTAVTFQGKTKHFIPDAVALPQEWVVSDPLRGLGVSGVLNVPDGTGVVPKNPNAAVPVRPGGDNTGDENNGRVRVVSDGVSDTIVFTRQKALNVIVVDSEGDIPALHRIPSGTAYVTRENVTWAGQPQGSLVVWGRSDAKLFGSDPVYFLQADFVPAMYTDKARLVSKSRFVFRFPEVVTLYVAIDGTRYWWESTQLSDPTRAYTTEEVAADIQGFLGPVAYVYAHNGSIVIEAPNPNTGSVEIGWGLNGEKDPSGATLLGFVPGWRAVGGVDNWLPDSGVSFGMSRTPLNPHRVKESADYVAVLRVGDQILQRSVAPSPFVFFDAPPLQDVAGYDEGVFFNLKSVVDGPDGVEILDRNLHHYVDVVHRFGEKKLLWVESTTQTEKVQKAVSTLGFGQANIVPESLLGAPGIGGGLYVSDGGSFEFQEPNRDFVLLNEGASGTALLIRRFGDSVLFGGRGTLIAGSNVFSDPDANFIAASNDQATDAFGDLLFDEDGDPLYLPVVREGYRLKIASGSYLITEVVDGTNLVLDPTPSVGTSRATSWEIFRGFGQDVYDPGIIADQVYRPFNHIPSETFRVRVLSKLGPAPVGASPRLRADMEAAVTRGRAVSLRVGLRSPTDTNVIALTPLNKQLLGSLANNSLVVPSGNASRFSNARFAVLVGTDTLYPVPVTTFSTDPLSAEYLTIAGSGGEKGLLKFNSTLLSAYAQSDVYFVETFQAPSELEAGQAEYDPETGDLNLSAADTATTSGEVLWFVEQMITENSLDVRISPLAGSAGFQEPVKAFQAVEFAYERADQEGRRVEGSEVVEFLPVFVRDEVAERVDSITFRYNLSRREMDLRLTPTVRVGAMIQNFGSVVDCVIEPPRNASGQGLIKFLNKRIPDHVKVFVTYASFEANGGERAYTASQLPIYRPPFYIPAGKGNFGLRSDRTGDFQIGQMIRIGESCHYIRRLQYFSGKDVTRVDIFPPTFREVGSRSPGNDVLTLVTASPITTVVDPDGDSPVTTQAAAGFMQVVPLAACPFEPVEAGQQTITFLGDMTRFAVPGHILEVAGMPFTVSQATLNEDGTRTKITLTGPFAVGVSIQTNPTVKLSSRPVYPPDVRDFLGAGPVMDSEPLELVLFGETDALGATLPGRTLVRDVEWSIDTSTGAVRLLAPAQDPLGPGQKLLLSYTKVRTLLPYWTKGIVAYPRTLSTFLYNTLPSTDNRLLGAVLSATFSYRSPDTFYCRALTLTSFLGEAVKQAVDEIKAKQPAGGAIRTFSAGSNNWEKGNLGLIAQERHLYDQDRAARTFLDFYNTSVVAFEQVLETVSGNFVGDRDGKFRFFVGKGKDWPTPGYEDAISGRLTPRFVWSTVFSFTNPYSDTLVFPSDPVTSPYASTLVDGVVDGPAPNVSLLRTMLDRQKPLIRNDVDDVLLVGVGRSTVQRISRFPYFRFRAGAGEVRRMGEVHRFSRLFPTQTKAFLITNPGIGADEDLGDPGVYARRRFVGNEVQSTFRSEIGQLANPALGAITNVTQASVYRRRARARIWGYFPQGIPQGTFASVVAGDPADIPAANIPEPCVVAFPVPLNEVPMRPSTGYPDVVQLLSDISGTGTVPDLNSGDSNLATPGFLVGDQINWGKPNGKTYEGLTNDVITISPYGGLSFDRYTALFVRDIQHGCIVRFQDKSGNPIVDPSKVLVGTGPAQGIPAGDWPIGNGDTIFAVPADGGEDLKPSDPPTLEELSNLAAKNDLFDVRFTADGKLTDITLPSFRDPTWFGLKEITGQNPPPPLATLEGDVQFVAVFQNPVELPCLKGEFTDDSGDYQIPYLRGGNTEIERFGQISVSLPGIVSDTTPEEIQGDSGLVQGSADIGSAFEGDVALLVEAAALLTSEDVFPKTNSPGAVGVADLRPYDLLLVEVDDTASSLPVGAQGILSVGSVAQQVAGSNLLGIIKPPRFVTPTTPPPRWQVALGDAPVANDSNQTGSRIIYELTRYCTYLNNPSFAGTTPQSNPRPLGLRFKEVDAFGADGVLDQTILDFGDAGVQVVLHDGLVAGVGGLNDLWSDNAADVTSDNTITIEVFARTDTQAINGPGAGLTHGQLLMSIVFTKTAGNMTVEAIPGLGPVVVSPGDVSFGVGPSSRQIQINQPGIFDWGPGAGTPSEWYLAHTDTGPGPGQSLESIYGYEFSISISCAVSETGWIDRDRLTFRDVLDLRQATERGTVHPDSGLPLETILRVTGVRALGGYVLDVNDVNGGVPFTFLRQSSSTAPYVNSVGGWFPKNAGQSPEHGSLEVPAFEQDANTEILSIGSVRFAAMPTSDIFEGTGRCSSKNNTSLLNPFIANTLDDRVIGIDNGVGNFSGILKGDLLVIDRAHDFTGPSNLADDWASVNVGTWPIRHAIAASAGDDFDGDGVDDALVLSLEETLGVGGAMFPTFPLAQRLVLGGAEDVLQTSRVDPRLDFAGSSRVYVILDSSQFGNMVAPATAGLWSATFTSKVDVGDTSEFRGLADWRWADGSVVADPTSLVGSTPGKSVSGMARMDFRVRGTSNGLPESDSIVGWHGTFFGVAYVHGISAINLVAPGGATVVYDASAGDLLSAPVTGAGRLTVEDTGALSPQTYDPVPRNPVYPNVPVRIWFDQISSAQWTALNGAAVGSECLIPGTLLQLHDFAAQAGIFLETSFPRQGFDLGALQQHVVDSDHSLNAGDVGYRNFEDHTTGVYPTTPEGVHFYVRRPRRWHEYSNTVGDLLPLRYAYEIRRGRLTSPLVTSASGFQTVSGAGFVMDWNVGNVPSDTVALAPDVWNDGRAYTGTNLGAFDDSNVNIHPGDIFRLLGENGELLDQAEIAAVMGPGTLKLAVPGITTTVPQVGQRFEIWLQQAPVPHEQSMEHLLDLATFRVVHRTHANYDTETGGYSPAHTGVYEEASNRFFDDHPVSGVTFASGGWAAKGVRVGDILIIDPTPTIPIAGERGAAPRGDTGVGGRAGFEAGGTSALDDNRGFYRVVRFNDSLDPPEMVVTGVHTFAGSAETPVVFPGAGHPNRTDIDYAVYPTVSESSWVVDKPLDDKEGQNDLRPSIRRSPGGSYSTGYADSNEVWNSIRPVSYRIIRPNQMFSPETIDTILTVRERMLSWIDLLTGLFKNQKIGNYYVWMRDNHAHDLENLGHMANLFVESFMGHWNHSPYMNTNDCLSILDRRFWIQDPQLDRMEPTSVNSSLADKFRGQDTSINPPNVAFPGAQGPYTAYSTDIGGAVLPVLPGRVEEILNTSDRLRPIRYIWLAYRTHRLLGTLASISRFAVDLPERLEEQRQGILLQESTDNAGST